MNTVDRTGLKEFGVPLVVVVSGPSGVGKDAVFQHLRTLDRSWHFAVSATTRPRRRNERNGIDYLFLGEDEFRHMKEGKRFLEDAQVYGNSYGVPEQQVRDALGRGQDVILKIDVQGAATIKKLIPGAVMVFLAPPSMNELENRLRIRQSESPEALNMRIEAAHSEMSKLSMFDYKVVNHDRRLDLAAFCIDSIITAEKCRTHARHTQLLGDIAE